MQHKPAAKTTQNRKSDSPFSYRLPLTHESRFNDVLTVSRRSKASLLDESLDRHLPVLEKNYAPELRKLKFQRKAKTT